ncbi:MAG: hypothetical protein ACR2QM_20680 [Longimicrobiales bacterium]
MKIVNKAGWLAVMVVLAATPLGAGAQQWSPEQQEVWEAEVACLESQVEPIDLQARKACMHPDFTGWGVEGPVPSGFPERELEYFYARNTVKDVEAVPLRILVEGDMAVIQLMVRDVSSLDGGADEAVWVAWTDVMWRDNGVWRWIADHGHLLPGPD